MGEFNVRVAEMPRDLDVVQKLCWEYRDYLLNFSEELRKTAETFYPYDAYAALMEQLPVKHRRPRGAILLIERNGDEPFGCGMIQPLSESDAEVKRVFMRADQRRSGAGQQLSAALIKQARSDGYQRLLLDTSVQFVAAQRLYEKLGFKSRGPYSELPPGTQEHLVFYELEL